MSYPTVSEDRFEHAKTWAISNPRRLAREVCKMVGLLINREWADTFPVEPMARLLEEQLHALHNEAAAVREGNATLRMMLAFSYCGHELYRDDGELQDNRMQPHIDFKRDPLDVIQYKMVQRADNLLAEMCVRAGGPNA